MAAVVDQEAIDAERCIKEIVNGVDNMCKRLKKDVREMCELLTVIEEECRRPRADRRLEETYTDLLQEKFRRIYWALKMHISIYFGPDKCPEAAESITELQAVGRLQLVGLSDDAMNELPDQNCAVDPVSILLEIFSDISRYPRGSKEHAEDVFTKANFFLETLSSKNTFRPKVLAEVLHNERWSIGSSIAVGHLLRPLCLYQRILNFKLCLQKAIVYCEPLLTTDNRNWSSSAFSHDCKLQYVVKKAPCESCQMMFNNLVGFISNSPSDPLTENKNGIFLSACAEYCPVNWLLADDVELQRDQQLISTSLEKFKDQCSVLFRYHRTIVDKCWKAYDSEDSKLLKKVYNQIRRKVLIFGLKPECNNQLRPNHELRQRSMQS